MKAFPRPLFFVAVECLGVPVFFHWTVALVLLGIWSYCLIMGWQGYSVNTVALCIAIAWLLPMCAHEGGHAVAARCVGARVIAIVMGLGGKCIYEWPKSIGACLFVFSGGFLAQVLLFSVLYAVQVWSRPTDPAFRFFLVACSAINLILLVSNVVPYSSSDGVQILRALREAWRCRSFRASPDPARLRRGSAPPAPVAPRC